MCSNFVVQELNRGAVIMGLPDFSGKPRPMVLLNDVKPNNTVNYGMTLNAFQISSQCYNRFAIPIRIRWDTGNFRTCYIDTLYTLRFSQKELFDSNVYFVGILSKDLIDLSIQSLATYLEGDYGKMEMVANKIRDVRLEFLNKHPIVGHIDYKDVSGAMIRLHPYVSET